MGEHRLLRVGRVGVGGQRVGRRGHRPGRAQPVAHDGQLGQRPQPDRAGAELGGLGQQRPGQRRRARVVLQRAEGEQRAGPGRAVGRTGQHLPGQLANPARVAAEQRVLHRGRPGRCGAGRVRVQPGGPLGHRGGGRVAAAGPLPVGQRLQPGGQARVVPDDRLGQVPGLPVLVPGQCGGQRGVGRPAPGGGGRRPDGRTQQRVSEGEPAGVQREHTGLLGRRQRGIRVVALGP